MTAQERGSPPHPRGPTPRAPGLGIAALAFVLAGPLAAEEAASFDLIGDLQQKVTAQASDWDASPSSSWSFTADLKPRFTYGAASFQADSTWTLPLTADTGSAAPTAAVSEAYFRFTPAESLDVTFGQKRYNLGVGQTFTVGDSINPVIGFFDQKTGFRGAGAEWSPVSWFSASGAMSTEKNDLTGAGQLSVLVDQLQVTTGLVYRRDVSFNPSAGLSYDLFGVILTAEGAAEFLPQGKRPSGTNPALWTAPAAWSAPALSGSAGARYVLGLGFLGLTDVDLTVSGEYLHWGQGLTDAETTDWKATVNPAKKAVLTAAKGIRSQRNAFYRVSLTSGTVFSASVFAAQDLQDGSVVGQSSVTWAPWDNLELTAGLKAAQGDTGSSYETLGAANGNARYQASLSTTYHF